MASESTVEMQARAFRGTILAPVRRLDFEEIPLVDIGPLATNPAHHETLEQLRYACEHVGFAYLRNHGLDNAALDRLRVEAKRFFECPAKTKQQVLIDGRLRGYLPLDYASYEGEERSAISHQEGYWMGIERPINNAEPLAACRTQSVA
jgi:isopenicillin N synthase-like dioxygenase